MNEKEERNIKEKDIYLTKILNLTRHRMHHTK